MPVKDETAQYLTGKWAISMCSSPAEVPCYFCTGLWVPWCFSYKQRLQILDITGEPYVCCGGMCPCGPCGKACPEDQKHCWLCCEVTCCTFQSVAANRFLVQTRFDRENDPCDDIIIMYAACLSVVAALSRCFCEDDIADFIVLLSDVVSCTVCACMLAQQENEIELIKEQIAMDSYVYSGPPPLVMASLAPEQQQMVASRGMSPPPQYGSMPNRYEGRQAQNRYDHGQGQNRYDHGYGQNRYDYGRPVQGRVVN
eukprot:TRINITY_DN63016_c0_g1_i1.p2 TRINITY_DN63016_c0_g1~~TRINITY_DN63016_c0_g1_i1.p2  ORF type:complete len:255 (-),score=33.86 TRINITY_DN63016_c0_g1_i1:371-1135(-)